MTEKSSVSRKAPNSKLKVTPSQTKKERRDQEGTQNVGHVLKTVTNMHK